ncbi:MAG: leucine-rich repeat domain-containing protein, partial [Clostridiales bacterium]|nr:leucine-rich repeat domain-containing protein [Clostridiales bacterium]
MYEYKGSQFMLEEKYGFWKNIVVNYNVVDIETDSDEVWIPGEYDGKKITGWIMGEDTGVYLGVKVLHIPKEITNITVRNDIFPNLERVEIDPGNKTYYTDGKLIMAHDNMAGKNDYIAGCLVCKGEELSIPKGIKKIRNYAFYGTTYNKITFPKTDLDIEPYAFEGSQWLNQQARPVVIGNLLYKIDDETVSLNVPGKVRRIAPEAFDRSYVQEMTVPFFPGNGVIMKLNEKGSLRFLAITSDQADISIRLLRKLDNLEHVEIASGHKQYQSKDGVVFSVDGSCLVFYPPAKRDLNYAIPDGVTKIEETAFANQKYLEELTMPDSVNIIGHGAFIGCGMLKSVHMSPNIKRLPDSCAYKTGGVFEGCENLEEVILPESLEYLGSYAFYMSGITDIVLSSNLREIGEYALMAPYLNSVALPESLRRLGKGSLLYAERITAYEGTSKGLVSAVVEPNPDEKDLGATLRWCRCEVTVLHRGSEDREYFMIP